MAGYKLLITVQNKIWNFYQNSLEKNNYPLKRGIKDSWYKAGKKSFGCREILVMDPDGYLLRFSEELGERIINA